MITPTIPFLLFLGSVKWKTGETEASAQWKPTKDDVMKLRADMAKHEPRLINGRKQYPFELVMEQRGIISFGDRGEWQVVSPQEYIRINDTYGLHQWMQERDQDQLFQAFPEEKVAYDQKIAGIFASMRDMSKAKAA